MLTITSCSPHYRTIRRAASFTSKANISSDFTCSSCIRLSNRVSRNRFDALPVMRSNLSRSCSVESGVSRAAEPGVEIAANESGRP